MKNGELAWLKMCHFFTSFDSTKQSQVIKFYLTIKYEVFLVRITLDAHFSVKTFKNNIPVFPSLSQKFLYRNFFPTRLITFRLSNSLRPLQKQ